MLEIEKYHIATLTSISRIGPCITKKLVEIFGSAEKVLCPFRKNGQKKAKKIGTEPVNRTVRTNEIVVTKQLKKFSAKALFKVNP